MPIKKDRIAIVDGLRTPFAKSSGSLKMHHADELAIHVLKELLAKNNIEKTDIDEVIIGNVAQPADTANIARVIALKSGLPIQIPAYTVHRNCASGMEAISTGYNKIMANQADIIIAGGTESMTNIPFLFNEKMKAFFENLIKCKTIPQKINHILSFKPHYLKPIIGIIQGLTDPTSGLIMGLTAENLAKEFSIDREEQDNFALKSHQKAIQAIQKKKLAEEILPIPLKPNYTPVLENDDGPREDQSKAALKKLRPYFDRKNGTVTVGNSCPLTDGAAMTLLMKESKAQSLGLTPLGYINNYAYAGLEPERMGLGPIYATSKVLDKTKMKLKDIDLIEINEAFAVQVLANLKAFESDTFAKTYLGKNKAIGQIDEKTLNVNGGAIALGHPVGTSGTRIIITVLKELHRQKKQTGLATLCIGGGQGGAFIVERE